VDTSAEVYWNEAALARTVELVAEWEGIDLLFVILNAVATIQRGVDTLRRQTGAVVAAAKRTYKPTAIVIITGGIEAAEQMTRVVARECVKGGFPVYPSGTRAARALSHVIQYYDSRNSRLSSQCVKSG